MNYKTMLVGALLAGSMQQAWGMEEGEEKTIGSWLMNTSREEDLFNATQLAKAAEYFEALDLEDFQSQALIEAQKACAAAGINLRETQDPIFKYVAQEYRICLGTHQCANPSDLAERINTALAECRAHKNAPHAGNMPQQSSMFAIEDALTKVLKEGDKAFDGLRALLDVIEKCNKDYQGWDKLPEFQGALIDFDAYMQGISSVKTIAQKVQYSAKAQHIADTFQAACAARDSNNNKN